MRDIKPLLVMIETLEHKILVYSQNWGPDSDEVKMIQSQIDEINQAILDMMVP